jgi:opacity protein-like surface antigen
MKWRALALVIVFSTITCCAQTGSRAELFGGYSYAARDFSGGTIGTGSLNTGWNASLNIKVAPLVGLLSDFGGYYNHQNSSGVCGGGQTTCSSNVHTLMFGPQISFRMPKVTPFAHALFGFAHAAQSGTQPPAPFQSNNSLAFALGGGIDYHLGHHLALRAQGDYLRTRFGYADSQLSFNNNNFRFSTGLVVRF